MSDDALRIGWIGLDEEGVALASKLVDAGEALHVWDEEVERAEAFAQSHEHASPAASAADLASRSDVVFINVTGEPALQRALFSVFGLAAGAVSPRINKLGEGEGGLTLVSMSDVTEDVLAAAAERLAGYGVSVIAMAFDDGALMLAGDDDDIAMLEPVFALLQP
jgi:3-hydroxyisobutyrate dehydrogenase-like beta-hydroxyacid dehydrogenase